MNMLPGSVRSVFISFVKALVVVSGIAALIGIQNVQAARIYVNASAAASGANGLSWAKAFPTLQQALDKALVTAEADDIWIAQGTYVPTKIYAPNNQLGGTSMSTDAKLATFDLPDNVRLYGGFLGNESSLDKRKPDKYHTILSGRGILWHVVTAGNDVAHSGVTATLDGLTIRDGNAQGPNPGPFATLFAPFAYEHDYGGGLYVAFGSNITVNNVQFLNNVANQDGGGMFANNSTIVITSSYFANNSAGTRGGALEVLNTFEGSTAHTSKISSTIFDSNISGLFGGAIVGEGGMPNLASYMDIDLSTFVNNYAIEGGALVTYMNGYLNVSNSSFNKNIARNGDGGAILNGRAGAHGGGFQVIAYDVGTTVTNSRFVGNSAPAGNGGAIASLQDNYFLSGDKSNYRLTVTDSDVHANDAGGNGGGIYLNVSTATLTNNNLGGNHAAIGRAIYASQSRLNGSDVSLYTADH